jgi:hypothetical protein
MANQAGGIPALLFRRGRAPEPTVLVAGRPGGGRRSGRRPIEPRLQAPAPIRCPRGASGCPTRRLLPELGQLKAGATVSPGDRTNSAFLINLRHQLRSGLGQSESWGRSTSAAVSNVGAGPCGRAGTPAPSAGGCPSLYPRITRDRGRPMRASARINRSSGPGWRGRMEAAQPGKGTPGVGRSLLTERGSYAGSRTTYWSCQTHAQFTVTACPE